MLLEMLVSPVTKLIGDVIRRVLPPEKMSESERATLEHEIRLTMMKYDWSEFESEIQDRINARSLAQAELQRGNAVTNMLAALHRPAWSFTVLAMFVANVIGPVLGWPELRIGEIEKDIMRTVIIFYFGGRTVEKVSQVITNGNGHKNGAITPVDLVAERVLAKIKKPAPFTSGSGFKPATPEPTGLDR